MLVCINAKPFGEILSRAVCRDHGYILVIHHYFNQNTECKINLSHVCYGFKCHTHEDISSILFK